MSFTHPTPLDLAAGVAAALHGTRIAPVNALLPQVGVTPDSSPSEADQVGNLLRHMLYCADTNLRACKDGTLTIGVRCGRYRAASTDYLYEGQSAVALTNGATNYVYLVVGDTTVTVSTVGFPATLSTFVPIAIYVTSGGAISTEDWEADRRGLLAYWVDPSASSPTGTTATSFTMDDDNAGAAAALIQLRANRGSSNAEDAAVEWVEASGFWRFRSQHSTLTRCGIDCLSVSIAGTSMLDSNGAALVQSAVAGDGLGHSAGVLAVNVDGTTIETSADALRIKDAGVSAAKLSDAVADKLAQISIGDSSGASPRTVTIQALDVQGNNLAETVYVAIACCQDADGAALATNATIAVGATGTLVRSLTANKELVCKTNSSGTLTITVTDGTLETVYLLASVNRRSKLLDCSDIGTVTIS